MSKIDLQNTSVFGLPVWRMHVPEFVPYHEEVVSYIQEYQESGKFEAHKHGYGYQTIEDAFSVAEINLRPHVSILKGAFINACNTILEKRCNYVKNMDFNISQLQAWLLLQTEESWAEDAWHNHYPAILSASYCVQMPKVKTATEGRLLFRDPGTPNIFTDPVVPILPAEGYMTIFPSFLEHRPTPTPSADKWRITLNMDAFISWKQPKL